MAVMDGFQTGLCELKLRGLPPYGIMAAWRLPSDVPCNERCNVQDDVVGRDMLVASIVLDNSLYMSRHPPGYYARGSHTLESNNPMSDKRRRCSI